MSEKRFTVVQASAGSGKTYNLVKEYLKLLLSSQDQRYYRHILAITFTNKATNEMKERVLDALNGISLKRDKHKNLTKEISKEINMPEESVISRSAEILRYLIHDYAEFSISTIDRFVYRIIRSFSFELNLSGNAEIELNRDRIIEAGVDSFLESLTQDSTITQMLVEFSDYKFSSGKSTNIKKDLINMAVEVLKDRAESYVAELDTLRTESFTEVKNSLWTRKKTIENDLRQKAGKIIDTIDKHGIDYAEISGGMRALPGYLKNNFLSSKLNMKEPTSGVNKIVESGNWKSSKVKGERSVLIDSVSGELSLLLDDFIKSFYVHRPSYIFCDLMIGRVYSMALVKEVYNEIENFKKENELVQLDDFNSLIARLIDDSPVPYIYERVGERFNHYLIDEFQDTSKIQWYNLLPLVENTLADGFSSLIVGDSKQAIYRFRGGDVEQMNRLPSLHFDDRPSDGLAFMEEALKSAFERKTLESNFRSLENIVSYINDFFELVKESFPEELTDIYHKHKQDSRKGGAGSVKIQFLQKEQDNEERLELVGDYVSSCIEAGYAHGDISVLCRKRDQCTQVADYLLEAGHPVLSSESLKLHFSNEVQFLVHWIEFLLDKENKIISFAILQYLSNEGLLDGMSNDDLLRLWLKQVGIQEVLYKSHPQFEFGKVSNSSILETCNSLVQTFLQHKSTDPFVLNFLDHVSKFQTRWGNNASRFLEWWNEKGVELDVEMPPNDNAIKIMTIHKSKGLEFPVVILPFLHGQISPNEDHFWVHTEGKDKDILPVAWLPSVTDLQYSNYKEVYDQEMKKSLLDSLNLMYVAMSRAAEHLFILSTEQNDKSQLYREENILWKSFQLTDYVGSEESAIFSRGELKMSEMEKKNEADSDFVYTEGDVLDWKKKVSLKYRIDKNVLSEDEFTAQEYGNFMHDVLSRVNYIEDLPEVLESYISGGLISKESANELRENIEKTIIGSEVEEYFQKDSFAVFNEREIMTSEGGILRPDRMMVNDEEVVIIDYKTGIPDEKHEDQLRTYSRVLGELEDKRISSFLIYFGMGEIRRVA